MKIKPFLILKILCVFVFLATLSTKAETNLKLAGIFSDNMILQQEMPVPVWGWATPGEKITVHFENQNKSTIVGADGKWMLKLNPVKASFTPKELIITGSTQITFTNVLVGEVWICSGQSNMKMPVDAVAEVKALTDTYKNIRSFSVKRTVSFKPEENLKGQWEATYPNSAVAFAFANSLQIAKNVPVGIILSCWGSSSIEAWMPRTMVDDFPHFKKIMDDFDANSVHLKKIEEILASKTWGSKEDVFLRRQPNILYNAMIHPLIPFACKGIVWYQGERNTRYLTGLPDAETTPWFHQVAGMLEYGDVLSGWIRTYRHSWNKNDLHLMVVMLPGYGSCLSSNSEKDINNPTAHSWAWIRESQLKILNLPNTSIVNTIDLGDVENIHPKDKLPIGERLALLAQKNVYGKKVTATGPMFKSAKAKNGKLTIQFDNAKGLKTSDGNAPSNFWVSDKGNNWYPAKAEIKNNTVVLTSTSITQPLYCRYAFAAKPNVNLVNSAGLPAYPFRTDSFKP